MSSEGSRWMEELASRLTAHPKVVLAFLFGSFSRGEARANSDVDMAVYLTPQYSEDDVSAIWGDIEEITGRDVDLVILNSAPPGIAWTAMKGQVLVDKDPGFHLELMLQKSAEAEDFREFILDFLHLRERWREANAGPVS